MLEKLKKTQQSFSDWYHKLPEKKKYVEFITALLSVPVMLTVIILNLNNLNQSKNTNQKSSTTTTTPIQILITGTTQQDRKSPPPQISLTSSPTASVSPTITPTSSECKKQIGPVTILSPQEGEIITKETVCITITTDSSYCPLTWSYSLNGGSWSAYTDKEICLYNLESGSKTMQFRIKSSSTSDTIELQRTFIYKNPNSTPTPTASSSGTLEN